MSLQVGPGEDVVNVEGDGGAKEKELLGSRGSSVAGECGTMGLISWLSSGGLMVKKLNGTLLFMNWLIMIRCMVDVQWLANGSRIEKQHHPSRDYGHNQLGLVNDLWRCAFDYNGPIVVNRRGAQQCR